MRPMNLNEFGRHSFVTWTTGLKERIREADKENQMRKYRGLTKEDKWVYGDYIKLGGHHLVADETVDWDFAGEEGVIEIEGLIEVIPETVGQFTGLKDENGKEFDWWEGDVFEVHGRSTLFRIIKEQGCFWFRSEITKERFPCYQVVNWADLPEKLGDSQTIFNQNPELIK